MVKRVLLGLLIIFVAIQFVRPSQNTSTTPPTHDDFIVKFTPPDEIATLLRTGCYDCHSNNTRYPWYDRVQPVAWWLNNHVNHGKHSLNFSIFGTYDRKRQSKKLDQMADQVSNREMPLDSYTWIHRDARFSDAQVQTLTDWIDAQNDKFDNQQ